MVRMGVFGAIAFRNVLAPDKYLVQEGKILRDVFLKYRLMHIFMVVSRTFLCVDENVVVLGLVVDDLLYHGPGLYIYLESRAYPYRKDTYTQHFEKGVILQMVLFTAS
jgi:hypothetical protein